MIYDAVFVVWVWKLYLAILNNGRAAVIGKTEKSKNYRYLIKKNVAARVYRIALMVHRKAENFSFLS